LKIPNRDECFLNPYSRSHGVLPRKSHRIWSRDHVMWFGGFKSCREKSQLLPKEVSRQYYSIHCMAWYIYAWEAVKGSATYMQAVTLKPSATSNRGSVMLLPLGAMHTTVKRRVRCRISMHRREDRRGNRMSEKRLLGKGREDAVLVTAWNVTTFTREMIREWRLCDIGGRKVERRNSGSSYSDSARCGGWGKIWLQKCLMIVSVVALRLCDKQVVHVKYSRQ